MWIFCQLQIGYKLSFHMQCGAKVFEFIKLTSLSEMCVINFAFHNVVV